MSATGYMRGHAVYYGECWRYRDTGEATRRDRPCAHCRLDATPEGHDGCLGALPGVRNACCGHGRRSEAYVEFDSGVLIRGFVLCELKGER